MILRIEDKKHNYKAVYIPKHNSIQLHIQKHKIGTYSFLNRIKNNNIVIDNNFVPNADILIISKINKTKVIKNILYSIILLFIIITIL